jgi:NAD(P)-dependent dehydrogenase (short-subunit alcohol dehydrogenase family)
MSPTALVTGGQQGIGLAVAQALAAAGFAPVIASLPPPDDPVVVAALQMLGPAARYLQHDVADLAAIPALLDAAGPVTALVANAGVPARQRGDLLDLTPESWDHVMGVNLRGTFFLAQAVARRMVTEQAAHYRSITFVTSVSAEMASPERGEYCISKAGAAMAARLFALRLAPLNIGVFDLRPGIIATPMTEAVRDRYSRRIEDGLVPAGRWGDPADIANIIVPLATGAFAFATGAAIPVDGGLSLARL